MPQKLAMPILPMTTTPSREDTRVKPKQTRKRSPMHCRPTLPQVPETVSTLLPPAMPAEPPTLQISNQHFKAVDKYRQACYVTYMYGENQAMAMTV